jgi:hypothetical protein
MWQFDPEFFKSLVGLSCAIFFKRGETMEENDWAEIDALVQEIAAQQEACLLASGRRLIPHLTREDLLQPNDFPELEEHPHFRFEEGVLMGIRTVQTALRFKSNSARLTDI